MKFYFLMRKEWIFFFLGGGGFTIRENTDGGFLFCCMFETRILKNEENPECKDNETSK